jgi:hypothetical protein
MPRISTWSQHCIRCGIILTSEVAMFRGRCWICERLAQSILKEFPPPDPKLPVEKYDE